MFAKDLRKGCNEQLCELNKDTANTAEKKNLCVLCGKIFAALQVFGLIPAFGLIKSMFHLCTCWSKKKTIMKMIVFFLHFLQFIFSN